MAITLAQLRTQARQRADMENSQFVSDSELTGYINAAAGELHDLLVERYEDYFIGQYLDYPTDDEYRDGIPLPADFLKMRSVMLTDGVADSPPTRLIPIDRINLQEVARYYNGAGRIGYAILGSSVYVIPREDASGHGIFFYYVSAFTPLTLDADTLFTVGELQRWSEYVIVDAAIRCLQKEESDVSVLMAQKVALIDRIKRAASVRDAGQPARVSEVVNDDETDIYYFLR